MREPCPNDNHQWINLGIGQGRIHRICRLCPAESQVPIPDKDRQTTWGQLKEQMADVADDTPLMVLYDGRAGVSTKIERISDDTVEWAEPHTVYLDISRGQ
jgi:hypothetical protein